MTTSDSTVHRRRFIGLSLGAFAGASLPAAALTIPAAVPAWRAALEKHSSWMKQEPDGRWHCGSKNLAGLTGALLLALDQKKGVRASGSELSFTERGTRHRVVLHHLV